MKRWRFAVWALSFLIVMPLFQIAAFFNYAKKDELSKGWASST